METEIDSIPTASDRNELSLSSNPPYNFSRWNPPVMDSSHPKLIWCMCFTDLSDTAIEYPSLSCALSTSSIVVAILPYFLWFGANVTNSIRSLIHAGWSANSCLNDYAGPSDNSLSILNSTPSSLYTFPPADVWIQTGTLCFVGRYSSVVSIHDNCVPIFVRSYTFHSLSSWGTLTKKFPFRSW